ncbi:alpha-galactosidase [Acidipila sp. 4G-K13]|uniref:PKD domain-containing protein n=2 Tax=Paracidobacterium acidisoli TaxID=2303751 RepID=A0A372IKT0_9BACT|nr:PKD domain-containing protein [Paracidobacterium acidisoli]MBT9332606.1 alpha-galactosidase [Paracidobacterium acidisoli]
MSRTSSGLKWGRILLLCAGVAAAPLAQSYGQDHSLTIKVSQTDGKYSLELPGSRTDVLHAGIAAEVDGRWLRASDYPRHEVSQSQSEGYLGEATDWQITYTGLNGQPDLVCHLRVYSSRPFADIQVTVRNTTSKVVHVEGIRSVDATEGAILDLGGPAADDRVLSDSWSEDRPGMTIHDLADAKNQMHRGVGSQIIYNLHSHESLFFGALTSDRFITVYRLHLADTTPTAPRLANYEVDSTGTTEMELENSLEDSPTQDQIQLNLPVEVGGELAAERILFSLSKDYYQQLDTYGSLIKRIHHARTTAPPLMGWWSWTAYYFGLNEGAAITNAEWEAEHLKSLGYNIFHIDEGYQYARGEYTTANAPLFPNGLAPVFYKAHGLGLIPAIWTAPFEVTERSWVYENHPDWLVKNAAGQPIHAGTVEGHKDQIYVLDTTNPDAAKYLHDTYVTLTKVWGLRYIKMDFMDDSAVEGYYYKPNTTALEAERIGLGIIRDAVGNGVWLDKDGSPMLNPVGYVDYGRISQDTGHTFGASKEAATGIAARYFMNRNYFVADPDAFTVSTQTIADQAWHESTTPATLDEAEVSISLAAVSGGMFEIGDNLPSLSRDPQRLALIENQDLIDMIRLGKASHPLDLMNYSAEDKQPSLFLLKENSRQSILTVFDWTEGPRDHSIDLASIGLPAGSYTAANVLDSKDTIELQGNTLNLHQPAHSVRVIKLINTQVQPTPPDVTVQQPSTGDAGADLTFSAKAGETDPVLTYHWDFGDGVSVEGAEVTHAYTEPGDYDVHLSAKGLDGLTAEKQFHVQVTGHIPTAFEPEKNRRLQSSN